MSEKEAEMRASLTRLDDAVTSSRPLSTEDIATLRRQLEDGHVLVREQQDHSKQVQEENEILSRRKDELEGRLNGLEQEYEELLDKSIREDERVDGELSANVQDIKVRFGSLVVRSISRAVAVN